MESEYAEIYAESHRGIPDVDYFAGYADLLLLDRILSQYRLLDVGCGTGGYLRHLTQARAIVAIDSRAVIVDKARSEFSLPHVEFRCAAFEAFSAEEPFDAIRLSGTIGWYTPWRGNEWALERAVGLLNRDGILVLSYLPPRKPLHWLKMLVAPKRTVVISGAQVTALAAAVGLRHLISIAHPNGVWALFAKSRQT